MKRLHPAIMIAAFLAGSAAAQGDPATLGTPEFADGPRREVRVRTRDEPTTWLIGDLAADDSTSLVLATKDGSRRFPHDDILAFQVRVGGGNHAGTGAAVGAIVLGTAALAMGAALASDDFFDVGGGEIAAGGMAGAMGGAMIGALIGWAIPKHDWEDAPGWEVGADPAPDGSPAAAVSWSF